MRLVFGPPPSLFWDLVPNYDTQGFDVTLGRSKFFLSRQLDLLTHPRSSIVSSVCTFHSANPLKILQLPGQLWIAPIEKRVGELANYCPDTIWAKDLSDLKMVN